MKIMSSNARIAFVLLLFTSSFGFAQDSTPLAAKGVGSFDDFGSFWSAGMGNSGIALARNGFLSNLNPATWAGLQNVQFSAAYLFSGVSSQDKESSLSSYAANGSFGGGIFAMPLDRNSGLTIAGGFEPLSSYAFTISAPLDSSFSSATYKSTGAGGLGEGFVGMSLAPLSWISLGGAFQYAFGRIENVTTVDFSNSSYTSTYSDYSSYLRAPSGTIGALLSNLDKLTGSELLKGLSIGGFYKFAYNLSGSSILENLYEDSLYSPYSENSAGYIPPQYGIGLSEKLSEQVTGLLEFRAQPLSRYHDTYTVVGSLRDVLLFGGGVEIYRGRGFNSLYDSRIIRAGFYYEKTQFEVPTKSGENEQLDELFLTGGIELPISYSATASLSLQYGLRGLSSDLVFKEQIFRLFFSISMGEGWFARAEGN